VKEKAQENARFCSITSVGWGEGVIRVDRVQLYSWECSCYDSLETELPEEKSTAGASQVFWGNTCCPDRLRIDRSMVVYIYRAKEN
jgi:hypothetical protein